MTTITPTDRSQKWFVQPDSVTGTTALGEVTAVGVNATATVADDEAMLLNAVSGETFPALPGAGAELEEGEIYDYDGTLVMVRQSHTRTNDDPTDISVRSLFFVYRPDADGLEWVEGEQVSIGDRRIYDGTEYECIQAHTSQFTPDVTPALWTVVPTTAEWKAGVAYTIGDIVTYQDASYECRQSHTSQVGWEPPNVPALWLAL